MRSPGAAPRGSRMLGHGCHAAPTVRAERMQEPLLEQAVGRRELVRTCVPRVQAALQSIHQWPASRGLRERMACCRLCLACSLELHRMASLNTDSAASGSLDAAAVRARANSQADLSFQALYGVVSVACFIYVATLRAQTLSLLAPASGRRR